MNERRATDYLERHDLKAIVATTPVNVAYMTGFDCWLYREYTENVLVLGAPRRQKEAFAMFAPDSEPVLLTDTYTCLYAEEIGGIRIQSYGGPAPRIAPAKGEQPHHVKFFREVMKNQEETPAQALVTALKDAGIAKGRVGVEMGNLRPETKRAVGRALPSVELLDATETLSLIRMVKTPEEQSRLKAASRINEDALFKSLAAAREGSSIKSLSDHYMVEVSKKGAVFDHYFYSPDGLYLSASPGYRLRDGEYTMIDSGCTYGLYYGDMASSIGVGDVPASVTRTYDTIWGIIDGIAGKVGPGTRPSEMRADFEKAYRGTGIRDPDYQAHGIGIEPREYPIMGQGPVKKISDDVLELDTDIPLEEGMVISIETSLYEFGRGSFEVERTFQVGKRKLSEITSKKDRSMVLV